MENGDRRWIRDVFPEEKEETTETWYEQLCSTVENFGIETLTNEELLAILFGDEAKDKKDCLKDVQDIVRNNGETLRSLGRLTIGGWENIEGVDTETARILAVAFEISKRFVMEERDRGKSIVNPRQIFERYCRELEGLKTEHFYVIFLNSRNKITGHVIASENMKQVPVHAGECFSKAIRMSAAAIVLMHNHTSGDPTPNGEDIALTREFMNASEILKIDLLDHVIIAGDEYFSFLEKGMLGELSI